MSCKPREMASEIYIESNLWEDIADVNNDTILTSIDTFHYKIKEQSFIIYLQTFIDSTWYQDESENRFALFLDTIFKQESVGMPKKVELRIQINETRIDSIFDPDDPFVILGIDTVPPPHNVTSLAEFNFIIEDYGKINSEFIWVEELAKSQPGLEFGLIQIDTYKNRIVIRGLISDLPDLVSQIWNDSSESIILYGYTLSPKHTRYPDLDFNIHLIK